MPGQQIKLKVKQNSNKTPSWPIDGATAKMAL